MLPSLEAKWRSVVRRIEQIHVEGRPVLVGTSSVSASEILSQQLTVAGLEHRTLNARQDRDEAATIALAGERGRITVATNMAGRGTDITLGPGVAKLGRLHVIVTERHEAARIDRQLIGRCARQGDPGSYELILSLEDPLLERDGLLRGLARVLASGPTRLAEILGGHLLRYAQWRTQRLYSSKRHLLLRSDARQDSRLAFSGRPD